jgi:hypothetical protein
MAPRIITIRAQPTPIDIDTAQTAMIRVDIQTDFATKDGVFAIGERRKKIV